MKYLISLVMLFSLIACQPSSNSIERQKQEEMSKQAVNAVGFPSIVNFTEKKHLKDILELRDRDVATITYIRDMNGKLHKVCSSLGFGIPYSTQFTNPQTYYAQGSTLPQADPNGLFSPASSDATWVLCLNPKTGKLAPTYVEDRITVSTFELTE